MFRKGLLSSFYIQDKLIPEGITGILIGISPESVWRVGCEGLLQTTGSASLGAKEQGHGRGVEKGSVGAFMLGGGREIR